MAKKFQTLRDRMTPPQKQRADQLYEKEKARYQALEDAISGYLAGSIDLADAAAQAGVTETEFLDILKVRGLSRGQAG